VSDKTEHPLLFVVLTFILVVAAMTVGYWFGWYQPTSGH
jgi:hypothetical protein